MRNYGAVYQNTVRIRRIEKIFFERSVIMIDYGKAGTRSICSHYRWDDDNLLFLIKGCGFRRIHSGTASYSDNGINVVFLHDFSHSGNLGLTGNAAENLIVTSFIRSFKAFFQLVMTSFIGAMRTDKEIIFSHILCFLTERKQCISSLNIFQRISHFSKHFHFHSP